MALRYLLRRIPLRSPSGPRMGPGHGVSPATAAAVPRFMTTQFEGEQRICKASLMKHEKSASRLVEATKAHNKLRKEQQDVIMEKFRRDLDDLSKYGRNWRIFGTASAIAIISSTGLLIYWDKKPN